MQDCPQPAPGVFVGVDVAKGKHYACALSARGEALFSRPVPNDEGAIRRLIEDAAAHGSPALVVDTTSSAAVLALGVAAECEIPVAYVTGLAMRRAADLYAGAAKTDPKDAQVLADYARRNADRLTWTTVTDELLARLRILNGRDTDLAGDATRAANRLRDALLAVSPALERAVGDRLVSVSGLRAALAKWPTPSALRAAGKARVRGVIAKRSKRTAQKLTDQIWAALAAQTVTVVAETTWAKLLVTSQPTWTGSSAAASGSNPTSGRPSWSIHWEKSSTACAGSVHAPAPRTLAEIGDPNRFANPARLAAYAGLAPSTGNQAAPATPDGHEAATTA